MNPRPGEVWLVDLGFAAKTRPVVFDIAIVVLQAPSNRLADLKPLVPAVIAALTTAVKGQAAVVSL